MPRGIHRHVRALARPSPLGARRPAHVADLVAAFEQVVRSSATLTPVKTFEDLIADFGQDFAQVAHLLNGLNAVLRSCADPSAMLEIEWGRSRAGECLEGCIVARRSGQPVSELHIEYAGGLVGLRSADSERLSARSADPIEITEIIAAFAMAYFG